MMNPIGNRKLPGFTIIELVIVMLLSGIVIGITYLYFTQFQSYIRQGTSHSNHFMELGQFISAIERDMEEADEVFFTAPDLLSLYSHPISIQYEFNADYTIRRIGEIADTLQLVSSNIQTKEMYSYNQLISLFEINIGTKPDNMLPLVLYKNYTSQILFNNFRK